MSLGPWELTTEKESVNSSVLNECRAGIDLAFKGMQVTKPGLRLSGCCQRLGLTA